MGRRQMEEFDFMKNIERVKAPDDFDERVLEELSKRKVKNVRTRQLRLLFAGAFSALAVIIVITTLFILPHGETAKFSALEKGLSSESMIEKERGRRPSIPIIEEVNYSGEIRNLSHETQTIYILEQVSESTDASIKY